MMADVDAVMDANTTIEIRERIDSVIGVDREYTRHNRSVKFNKQEMASILVELGVVDDG